MIERTVLEYLQSHTGIPCYLEIPLNPPDRFIVMEKTGSTTENYITSSTIAVQSYGKTLAGAIETNELVKETMPGMTELDEIGGCYLNSDYNFTDTSTNKYRYQAVFDITHY